MERFVHPAIHPTICLSIHPSDIVRTPPAPPLYAKNCLGNTEFKI